MPNFNPKDYPQDQYQQGDNPYKERWLSSEESTQMGIRINKRKKYERIKHTD